MKKLLLAMFVALLMVGCGDPESEFERTKRLAESGDKIEQNNLGVMYTNGEGVPEDDKQAVQWYRKSAEQGYADAQFNLGTRYSHGEGVPEDDNEAFKW